MTSTVQKERLRRARDRKANGIRRVAHFYVDGHGLHWEGRIRELERDPKPILTVTVSGPMELPWDERLTGVVRLDMNKYVHIFPLVAEPLPWTRPRDTTPVPGVMWQPAIGVIHSALFKAGRQLIQQIVEVEAA